jgi:hypothetical protein
MEESYQDFLCRMLHKTSHDKNFKVRHSWGVYDSYKYIRKKGWYNIGHPVKEKDFYAIIRNVNKLFAHELSEGHTVIFPFKMGRLELWKGKRGVSIVDGKLKITYPVDWNETLKMWYEDSETRKNKTLLRMENPYVYHLKYCKGEAVYNNKCFYEFALNRFIKRALSANIQEGKVDTFWEHRYEGTD